MKKTLALLLLALIACLPAFAEDAAPPMNCATLLGNMALAYWEPTEARLAQIDADAAALDDMARAIADQWKETWLNPDYALLLYGADDPAQLPVDGRHAFAVLGYELKDGEMRSELKGRCEAAAAAARAFPDSVLVCTGGATGENNPEGHTEAGMMKAYLVETCGIAPERVLTDESARSTVENAHNTMAMLKEEGIDTLTVVTSDYHQLRGQSLYNAVALQYARDEGWTVRIVGNFCYAAGADAEKIGKEPRYCVTQLARILELPEEEIDQLNKTLGR